MCSPRTVLSVLLAFTTGAVVAANRNCTESSQTSPLIWVVENLQYSSRVKSGSFRLTNKANGHSTLIYCDIGRQCRAQQEEGEGDLFTNTTAAVSLTAGSVDVALNQTWNCGYDEGPEGAPFRSAFSATAAASIPVQCDSSPTSPGSGRCTSVASSYFVYGSLISSSPAITTDPSYPPASALLSVRSCNPGLACPTIWQINNARYWDVEIPCTPGVETPQPPPANCPVNGVGLEFVLLNILSDTTTACKGVLRYYYPFNATAIEPSAASEIHCELAQWPGQRLETRVAVRHSTPSFEEFSATVRVLDLAIEQSWACDDADESLYRKDTAITASASTLLPLSCSVQSGSIDFWSQSYPWHNTTCTGQSAITIATCEVS